MQRVRTIAKSASRRLTAGAFLAHLGRTLTYASAAGLALIVLDRLIGPGLPWWALLGAPALLALAWSVAVVVRNHPGPLFAAAEVDAALALRDRLSSGLSFASLNGAADDPFAQHAMREAERRAATVRVRHAAPVRLDAWWWAWPSIGALAVLAAMLLPTLRLLSPGANERIVQQTAQAQEREAAADQMQQSRDEIERILEELGAASPDQLNALDDLTQELEQGRLSADEARAQAAAQLEELARQQELEAQRLEEELAALQDRLAGAEGAGRRSGASAFENALRRGDFAGAQQALSELERQLLNDELSDEQREQLAKDLEQLAQELLDNAPEQGDGAAQAQEALRNHGLSEEDIRSLTESTDPQSLSRQMQDKGMDPEAAQRLAQRLADENRRRQACEQAEKDARELSESLREAASDLREPAEQREQRLTQQDFRKPEQQGQCQGVSKACDKLSDLASRGQCSGQARDGAAQMREQARSLSGGGQGAGSVASGPKARPPSDYSPTSSEDMDVRRSGENDRVIAEWLNPRGVARGDPGAQQRAYESLREAAESAERAIEEQAVPRRYSRAVREYFRRLPDAVARPPAENESPAPANEQQDDAPASD